MIKSYTKGASAVIRFSLENKLNIASAGILEKRVKKLIKKMVGNITINFTGIKFIDSAGFRVLMHINENSRFEGTEIILSNISAELLEIFLLLKLENKFKIQNNFSLDTPHAA